MRTQQQPKRSPEYWEARLKTMHLTMTAGREDWLSYGHEVSKLDTDGRNTFINQPEEKSELHKQIRPFVVLVGGANEKHRRCLAS